MPGLKIANYHYNYYYRDIITVATYYIVIATAHVCQLFHPPFYHVKYKNTQ